MEVIKAPLKGKVAIVTGASRGIGAGVALKFAEHGCSHVAITYRTKKDVAERVLASILAINPDIKTCAIPADVLDPDFGPKVVEQVLLGLGIDRIDIVVSNATFLDIKALSPVAVMEKAEWDAMLNGAAWASLSLARAVIKVMPPGGRIIMMSSGASKVAVGDPRVAYSAGKAALDAVSRNLAAAWSVKYDITVNSISVGATNTDTLHSAFKEWGPEEEQMVKNISLLKRIGTVEEVSNITAFVASPQASWITGNQIPANGGALSMLQS